MKQYLLCVSGLILFFLAATAAQANGIGRQVEYRAGDTVCKGFIAEDPAVKGKRPAVIVVHEWWGNNAYIRRRTMMLAELGYVAFAIDLYGDGKIAEHPEDAARLSNMIIKNKPVAEERFNAALEFIRQQPLVDATRIAAIGYSLGGEVVLNMARSGITLRGVVSFHGNLATDNPALPGEMNQNILVFNGEKDSLVRAEQVKVFLDEMALAGAPFRYIEYPGVKHGFTNPNADRYAKIYGLQEAYNKRADQNSWAELQRFFHEIFKK